MRTGGFVCRDFTPEQVGLGGDGLVQQGSFTWVGLVSFGGGGGVVYSGDKLTLFTRCEPDLQVRNTRSLSPPGEPNPSFETQRQKLLLVSHLVD